MKRVVVTEELFALTQHQDEAMMLYYFLAVTREYGDFHEFLKEEVARHTSGDRAVVYGWHKRSYEMLVDELMVNKGVATISRRIQSLVDKGYLLRRHNPKYKHDRKWQYRVDLLKIQRDLGTLGYCVDGTQYIPWYTQDVDTIDREYIEHPYSTVKDRSPDLVDGTGKNDRSITSTITNFNSTPITTTRPLSTSSTDESIHRIESKSFTEGQCRHSSSTCAWDENMRGNCNVELAQQMPEDHLKIQMNLDPYGVIVKCMNRHRQRPYEIQSNDIVLIKRILDSGVPLDFILRIVDATCVRYPHKNINGFAYFNPIITERWRAECAKHAEYQPSHWDEGGIDLPQSPSKHKRKRPKDATVPSSWQRDDRYKAFYALFPDS